MGCSEGDAHHKLNQGPKVCPAPVFARAPTHHPPPYALKKPDVFQTRTPLRLWVHMPTHTVHTRVNLYHYTNTYHCISIVPHLPMPRGLTPMRTISHVCLLLCAQDCMWEQCPPPPVHTPLNQCPSSNSSVRPLSLCGTLLWELGVSFLVVPGTKGGPCPPTSSPVCLSAGLIPGGGGNGGRGEACPELKVCRPKSCLQALGGSCTTCPGHRVTQFIVSGFPLATGPARELFLWKG